MLTGSITSATSLTEEELAQIVAHFSEILGEEVTLTQSVDPGRIGGFVVEVGNRVWDTSFASKFQGIRDQLKDRYAGEQAMPGQAQPEVAKTLKQHVQEISSAPRISSTGRVTASADEIVWVAGLSDCMLNELVEFDNGALGLALNLEHDGVGIALLSEHLVSEGMQVRGTGKVLQVPVENLEGRTVDPLGRPIDGKGPLNARHYRFVENDAPAIIDRKPVKRPMSTGIIGIDSIVPIGKGQRELIIGDRQTGKTAIAIDAIINQRDKDVRCFYVAIGQKASTVRGVMETLEQFGALAYTTIICATASDSSPMQYIAPYAGCAMAEAVMEEGGDALIIYDDLSKHAVAYRALSLQLRRPPGREAYPGDVFYLHARLLERAAQLSEERGGGSMTALPIIETLNSDISAYIPTNVISITDGQIVLDTEYFNSGIRPAVNVGLSVSRVGGAAQPPAIRKEAGQLRLNLAQYRELKVFSQFASDLDASTKETLRYGESITEVLIQDQYEPISAEMQASLLHIISHKFVEPTPKTFRAWKKAMIFELQRNYDAVLLEIASENRVTSSAAETLKKVSADILTRIETAIEKEEEDRAKKRALAQANEAERNGEST